MLRDLDTLHLCMINLKNARAVQNAHVKRLLCRVCRQLQELGNSTEHLTSALLRHSAHAITQYTASTGTLSTAASSTSARADPYSLQEKCPNFTQSTKLQAQYTWHIFPLRHALLLCNDAKTFAGLSTLAPSVWIICSWNWMKISRVQKEYWLKQLIVGSFLPSVHNLHISPQKSVLLHDSLLPPKIPLFNVLRGCSSVSQASVVSPSD